MARVKNGAVHVARRRRILKQTKGFWGTKKSNYKKAKDTLRKGMMYATRDRKTRKRDFRSLWIARISAALAGMGISYSRFVEGLRKADIRLNRKILSNLAIEDMETFKKIVYEVND
ncbi:50S ribosomal protein L20 [Borrelia sp. RT5S]|uniref:50S ribosomal protein L20 n=1 Tax=Borrelia sp. RT5S TaxID=2898581 RepID=UPI001E38710C|nr:50S ribosomal protein L20 [Borrelia sp. RT5S]UGQ15884.1 50S ribosomal protein L20 [Borrelia sp. RT5S]